MNQSTVRTPNGLDLTYHQLGPGEHLALHPRFSQEGALILVTGQVSAELDDGEHAIDRADPFTAPAAGWYLPPAVGITVTSGAVSTDLIEVHTPVTTPDPRSAAVPVHAGTAEVRGVGSWQREVTTVLAPPQTFGLLLGETVARDGRWSTYPPHRHQHSDPPRETALQEAFAFRVHPSSGFGVLLTYDDTVTDAHTTVLTDTSLATVTHGYHTIATAAGHDLYYLWAAHGSTDVDTHFALHTDPAHAWLLGS